MKKKVVVVIDHQNTWAQTDENKVSIEEVYAAILREAQREGEVVDIRSFVPIYQNAPESWHAINQLALKFGITIEACAVLREGQHYKDVVDLAVLRWIIQYGSSADLVVLVTGDGDFTVAANELKKRGIEVIGRVVRFKNTSTVLFDVLAMRELDLAVPPIVVSPNNQFFLALAKAMASEEKLGKEEKNRLKKLARTEKVLPEIPSEGMTLPLLVANLASKLKVVPEECWQIVEVLVALDIVQLQPMMVLGATSQPSSQLQSLEATIGLNNGQG